MRFDDQKITSVGDLIAAIDEQRPPKEIVWYRGQHKAEWSLTPSLHRTSGGLDAEMTLFKRFKQDAVNLRIIAIEPNGIGSS